MTTTEHSIDRAAAVDLLERTDRINRFRGIGSPMGGPESRPRPLLAVLNLLDGADQFVLRPASALGFMILEIHSTNGWLSYYVWLGGEKREASWP